MPRFPDREDDDLRDDPYAGDWYEDYDDDDDWDYDEEDDEDD